MRLGRSGFAMKWRPNAIRLASPLTTVASAVPGSNPPAAIIGPWKTLLSSCAATGPCPSAITLATLHPGLNDMEIGQLDVVESFCDVAEQSARIAIRHAVEGAARRNAHADSVGAPDSD